MTRFVGLAVAVVLAGCTANRLEDEWQLTLDQLAGLDLAIRDGFPADGADGVAHKIRPYVLLTRPLTDDERFDVAALITGTGHNDAPLVDIDDDAMGVRLYPDELDPDRTYAFDLSLADAVTSFSTAPPPGTAFNMSSDLEVLSFGARAAQANTLNDLFEPGVYPLWVLQVVGTAPPFDLVFAPGRIDEEDPPFLLRKEYGYSGRLLDVDVAADGTVDHAQDGVFLPLWSAEDVILLYLEDVRLTGEMAGDGSAIGTMTLTGVLTTRWLLRMADAGPSWRAAVNVVKPDVDTNGNGIDDSATFTITSSPTPLPQSEIDF